MKEAGHTTKFRREMVTRAVASYNKISEAGTYYRSRLQRAADKMKTVQTNKGNWFRRLGSTTTIKVPSTIGDKLGDNIKEALRRTEHPEGVSIMVIPDGGKQ